jgi:hypothetical protein
VGDPAATWRSLRSEHMGAVERLLRDIDALDETAWLRAPAPEKWCPGQIAEHLVLSYDALLSELGGGEGMRLRKSRWLRLWIRLRYLPMVLRQGRLPHGAPAVREVRPGPEPRERRVVVDALRERSERFERELTRAFEAGGRRLTHPFFGRLTPLQTFKLVAVHLEHHRLQIAPVGQADFRPRPGSRSRARPDPR